MEDNNNMSTSKKRKKGTGDYCSAINCTNGRNKDECQGLSFFTLPYNDRKRCKTWILNMRRQDLIGKTMHEIRRCGYRLCSKHFESCQFNVPSERKRLKWKAIPTIFDVPNSLPIPPFPIDIKIEWDNDQMDGEQITNADILDSPKKEVLEEDGSNSNLSTCGDTNSSDFLKEEKPMVDSELLGYCSALYCSKNCRSLDPRTGNTVDMHPFPDPSTDEERCLKWITNLKNDSLTLSNVKSKRVCSLHFEASAYKYSQIESRCTLWPDAVPMLATQPNEENVHSLQHLNDTIGVFQAMLDEKQKKIEELEKQVCHLNSQNESMSKELKEAHKILRRYCCSTRHKGACELGSSYGVSYNSI